MKRIVAEILSHVYRVGEAYVLSGISDVCDEVINTLLQHIPVWRRDEALAIKHMRGRRECVLSFVLLQEILRNEYGVTEELRFEYGAHGKPSLSGHGDIHFNLSHCREAVACVVSRSPIAVDVECYGRYTNRLAAHVLSDDELLLLATAGDADREFTKLWTAKEALLKLTGEGVSGNMKNVLADNLDIDVFTNEQAAFACSVAKYKTVEIE